MSNGRWDKWDSKNNIIDDLENFRKTMIKNSKQRLKPDPPLIVSKSEFDYLVKHGVIKEDGNFITTEDIDNDKRTC